MNEKKTDKPWYHAPEKIPEHAHIAIIGGGIAGVCSYLHLKQAGFKATIIDKNINLMMEASGNPVAILDPFLSAYESVEQKYYLKAYAYALEFYRNLPDEIFVSCELVKMAKNWQEAEKFRKISDKSDKEFAHFKEDTLILPKGGYVKPLCISHLVEKDFIGEEMITEIIQHNDFRWSLLNEDNQIILEADAVILANSYDLSNFKQTKNIKLDQIGGQLTYVAPQFEKNRIICSEGYISPVVTTEFGKAHVCGATFERQVNPLISAKAHRENMDKSPFDFKEPKIIGGRRAIRAMTPDHLPLCGPAPDFNQYRKDYHDLHHGPKYKDFPNASYHKNLFINAGLGSRGFIHAPILGKYLANLMTGTKEVFKPEIMNALHPARFIIRELSKK